MARRKTKRQAREEDLPLILTPGDLKRFLNWRTDRIYSLFHRPDFPSVRHGKRYYVGRKAFLAWLNRERND